MESFRLLYEGSEGDFTVEFFTGVEIAASDENSALEIAERFEEDIAKTFKNTPGSDWIIAYLQVGQNPHLCFKSDRGRLPAFPNVYINSPAVTKCKLLQPQGEHKMLMGFPIYTEDDLISLSEQEFLDRMSEQYTSYFENGNRTHITFENISYWLCKETDQ